MPKTQTAQPTYQWDRYVEEAKIEPFRLEVSADETLVFEAPTGVALIRIMQGLREGDLHLILTAICGDQWDRVEQLLGGASHKAMPQLVEDLMDHFELYEDVTLIGPSGGKVTARRPRKIQALLNQGYRPAGEAPASRA
jgi:hypothetical protein